MKTLLKYLFSLLFVCSMSLCAVSCGDDTDEPDPGVVDPEDPELVEGEWREEGNKLIWVYTYDYGYGVSYTATWTLTFDGDTCVKSECACKFSSSEMADMFYQAWKEDSPEYPVTKSGNTVTIDYTALHRGLSKAEVKAAIEAGQM